MRDMEAKNTGHAPVEVVKKRRVPLMLAASGAILISAAVWLAQDGSLDAHDGGFKVRAGTEPCRFPASGGGCADDYARPNASTTTVSHDLTPPTTMPSVTPPAPPPPPAAR